MGTIDVVSHETDYLKYFTRNQSSLALILFISELYRVLFHAALHLCGYNDKKKKDKEIMRKKEGELLIKYFSE